MKIRNIVISPSVNAVMDFRVTQQANIRLPCRFEYILCARTNVKLILNTDNVFYSFARCVTKVWSRNRLKFENLIDSKTVRI